MKLTNFVMSAVLLFLILSLTLFSLGVYNPNTNQKYNNIDFVGFIENSNYQFIGTATAIGPNTIISCNHLNIKLDNNLNYFYNNGGSKIIGISRYPELDLVILITENPIPYKKIDKNIILESDLSFTGYGAGTLGKMQKDGKISIIWSTGKVNSFGGNIYNLDNDTISFRLNKPEDGMITYGDSGGCIVVNGSPVGMFQSFAESQDSDGQYRYTGYALNLIKCYETIYGKQ